MTAIFAYIPFLISLLIGYLILHLLPADDEKTDPLIELFLSAGLGIGISAITVFLNFILFARLYQNFVIAVNLTILIALIAAFVLNRRLSERLLSSIKNWRAKQFAPLLILIIVSVPLWIHGHFYRYGGWDAWAVWNLKAIFLFEGGDQWRNLFDPILWRSSQHYPLFLPFMNVWGWSFLSEPDTQVPVFTAFIFTFLTMGLLWRGLREQTNQKISVLSIIAILTLPFYIKISLSQYADIIVGFYLTASLYCFLKAKQLSSIRFAVLGGLFLGFLSFSKPEGLVSAGVLVLLSCPYFLFKKKTPKRVLIAILLTAAVAVIPTVLFQLGFAPKNQTFVNGLILADHRAEFNRVKVTIAFYLFELISSNWNGLWLILFGGILLSGKKSFKGDIKIFPFFFFLYWGIVTFYYFINTYFKIDWWLQVTLHRIAYATLPSFTFWAFYALFRKKKA